ncbi:OLC1v1000133C1 [Oldenlandia corymbosa var. corymbosa]|uniref:OLC1v1000133C1 n=1 Tax=Oldenlandia corymbosa var. corymbosa TaxID=529605 RepID=A0AAV1D280_OLDCO|nr:OLC1v1000133C1 [Oldenlandia corymbosa var. corymbosa]
MKAFNATDLVFATFQENTNASRIDFNYFKIFIQDRDEIAFTTNDEIHFGARYIQSFAGNWNGNGKAPQALIEGIADFVRPKAGYAPGQGNKWDEGFEVTAYFLDYCNGLKGGNFIAELNEKMRYGYSDAYFVELLGKTVDELWSDYKAQYGS